jgi:hypothetical protein
MVEIIIDVIFCGLPFQPEAIVHHSIGINADEILEKIAARSFSDEVSKPVHHFSRDVSGCHTSSYPSGSNLKRQPTKVLINIGTVASLVTQECTAAVAYSSITRVPLTDLIVLARIRLVAFATRFIAQRALQIAIRLFLHDHFARLTVRNLTSAIKVFNSGIVGLRKSTARLQELRLLSKLPLLSDPPHTTRVVLAGCVHNFSISANATISSNLFKLEKSLRAEIRVSGLTAEI